MTRYQLAQHDMVALTAPQVQHMEPFHNISPAFSPCLGIGTQWLDQSPILLNYLQIKVAFNSVYDKKYMRSTFSKFSCTVMEMHNAIMFKRVLEFVIHSTFNELKIDA